MQLCATGYKNFHCNNKDQGISLQLLLLHKLLFYKGFNQKVTCRKLPVC